MKSLLSIFTAAITCMLIFVGCGSSSSQSQGLISSTDNSASGKLIVGLDDTFAPMGFRNESGELVGFDIDIANAVGKKINKEIVFQPINWDTKDLELSSKKIDCIWNGMSKTPEREKSMTLSQPYLNNRIIIMSVEGVEIKTKDDLKNYKIGIQAKSAALEVFMKDDIYNSVKENVEEYPTYDNIILDMKSGRIDVMLVDEVLGEYKNANLDKPYNVAEIDFGEDLYVIGFRKEDTALCAEVEAGLKEVIASGEAEEISKKWFGKNIVLDLK